MASTQAWDPDRYQRNARFVSDLGAPLVELLAPGPDERILDLGCGDGVLTAKLAARCQVVGVDASPAFVEAARSRGLDVRLMDGQALTFADEFDAVFSNAALHWMKKADAVIAGVHRALRPGGRFVAEFGGAGNVATICAAIGTALAARGIDAEALNPWFYPDPASYQARLEAHGFEVRSIQLIPRPTPLPTGLAGWLEVFAGPFLASVAKADRAHVIAEIVEVARPALQDAAGGWSADYVRLRVAAAKRVDSVAGQGGKRLGR